MLKYKKNDRVVVTFGSGHEFYLGTVRQYAEAYEKYVVRFDDGGTGCFKEHQILGYTYPDLDLVNEYPFYDNELSKYLKADNEDSD